MERIVYWFSEESDWRVGETIQVPRNMNTFHTTDALEALHRAKGPILYQGLIKTRYAIQVDVVDDARPALVLFFHWLCQRYRLPQIIVPNDPPLHQRVDELVRSQLTKFVGTPYAEEKLKLRRQLMLYITQGQI